MLYVKEKNGKYIPAPETNIFEEANKICNDRLNLSRGARIVSSDNAKDAIAWKIRQNRVEVFACQFLNSNHECIGYEEICRGTINSTTVYPREVVKAAFKHDAAAVILVHNHPSGNPTPSEQDLELTKTLINVLKPLEIRVLDHLVVGYQTCSISDLGLVKF